MMSALLPPPDALISFLFLRIVVSRAIAKNTQLEAFQFSVLGEFGAKILKKMPQIQIWTLIYKIYSKNAQKHKGLYN